VGLEDQDHLVWFQRRRIKGSIKRKNTTTKKNKKQNMEEKKNPK